jgi:DNA topoisomerase-1
MNGAMADKKKRPRSKRSSAVPDTTKKQLVIVESPAKARTLNSYLGPEYVVMASIGHVRDLPDKNPKGVKDPVPGVDVEENFKPTYQVIKGKSKTLSELKEAAKKASGIWLATDMDREGEAIAWHLAEALKVKSTEAKRVVFNAITKNEIQKAFKNPQHIDMDKVNAQQARRILDRIVGYQVSPLLWKKVAGGLSAGRVQSVAVRLVVEREREIEAFVPEEYWRVTGYFTVDVDNSPFLANAWLTWLNEPSEKRNARKSNGPSAHEKSLWLSQHQSLTAELIEVDGRKFEPKDTKSALAAAERAGFRLEEKTETENPRGRGPAQRVVRLKGVTSGGPPWHVKSIQTKRTKSRPNPPFITSTLQQAAANQLDFTAALTMNVAQALYEGLPIQGMGSVGLITYMRTDSTHLSVEALDMARSFITAQFGTRYLPAKPNVYATSNKTAQEAHEAIRPTDVSLTPQRVRASLKEPHYRLYKLIWERFVASQMTDAEWDATTVLILGSDTSGGLVFRATGRILVFDGYHKVAGLPSASDEATLPQMAENQALAAIQIDPSQNFTTPPPRYTEASLVRKLESEGIGRPSTYAQIIQVVQQRQYVEKIRNRFFATDLGKVVTDKLLEAFPEIMQVGYTRDMEQQLDDIEEKHADWVEMLHRFYGPFKDNLDAAYSGMAHAKAETQPATFTCPQCRSKTVYRFGRKGRFLSCSNYPKCKFAAPIDREGNPIEPERTDIACPTCGGSMLLRKGRFGMFLSCAKYPECTGSVTLDKKGHINPPKTPPLLTDLTCPKCGSPLNLRRGARGPWLSCSAFPKCRGRLGWATLDEEKKKVLEKELEEHEKAHPQPVIRDLHGSPVGENYKPQTLQVDEAFPEQHDVEK